MPLGSLLCLPLVMPFTFSTPIQFEFEILPSISFLSVTLSLLGNCPHNCSGNLLNHGNVEQLSCDHGKNNTPWLSVPQFGDWDQKGVVPDYSMDFSKIREMRKQDKRDVSRASLGNEEELVSSTTTSEKVAVSNHHDCHQNHCPTRRRSILRYFNCWAKA